MNVVKIIAVSRKKLPFTTPVIFFSSSKELVWPHKIFLGNSTIIISELLENMKTFSWSHILLIFEEDNLYEKPGDYDVRGIKYVPFGVSENLGDAWRWEVVI